LYAGQYIALKSLTSLAEGVTIKILYIYATINTTPILLITMITLYNYARNVEKITDAYHNITRHWLKKYKRLYVVEF